MMRRMFLAVHVVPEPELLALRSGGMRRFAVEKFRWTDTEQFHITLKFLGEVSEVAFEPLCQRMRQTIALHSEFTFPLQGTGLFGSRYAPRVIWVGATGSIPLINLGEAVLDAASATGFPRERLPFVPHLTLARVAGVSDKHRLSQWITENRNLLIQSCQIKEVILFHSVLKPDGAQHIPLEQFPLHPVST
jgi:RNA 2',3'-cyclic 3'-phosphodiesterase